MVVCTGHSLARAHGNPGIELIQCKSLPAIQRFVQLRDALPEELRAMMTDYSAEEYRKDCVDLFLSRDDAGGFGLYHHDAVQIELISLFSLPGRRIGRILVMEAMQRGANLISCYDMSPLVSIYNSVGFEECRREKWNDSFAPRCWNYSKFGRPDFISLRRKKRDINGFNLDRFN